MELMIKIELEQTMVQIYLNNQHNLIFPFDDATSTYKSSYWFQYDDANEGSSQFRYFNILSNMFKNEHE